MADHGGTLAVIIDREVCMGSGMCVMYAAKTFAQDGETKAVVIEATGDPEEQIRIAVEACPTGALSFLDVAAESR